MKFLYIDGSGDPARPKPSGKSTTKFYCLFGISIDPEKNLLPVRKDIDSVIDKYFPESPPKELKYSWLVEGKNEFKDLNKQDRKKLADDIFNIIKKIDPTLFGVVIEKEAHYKKYALPENPKEYALRIILGRFTKYLERVSELGIVISDSEDKETIKRLRNAELNFRKKGIVIMPFNSPFSSKNKLQLLVENTLYQDSEVSNMIQLADFGAYALTSGYERGKSKRFYEIKDLFDKVDDKFYGLYVWPPRAEPEYDNSNNSYNPIFDNPYEFF